MRRDIRKGKVSATKDESGNIIVDTAELQRVYGQLTLPEVQETDTDSDKIVSLLEEQVAELRQALLGLLKSEKTEKAEIRALMPPPEEQQDSQQQVQDLTAQLQQSTEREQELLGLLKTEQNRTKALETKTKEQAAVENGKKQKPSILGYFRLRR